jgi:hypothetical protein
MNYLKTVLLCAVLVTSCGNYQSDYSVAVSPETYSAVSTSFSGSGDTLPSLFYRIVVKDSEDNPVPFVPVEISSQVSYGQLYDSDGNPVTAIYFQNKDQTVTYQTEFTAETDERGFLDLFVVFPKTTFTFSFSASVGGNFATGEISITDSESSSN